MDTLETGASSEAADNGDASTDKTDESTSGDTSKAGEQDADSLRQRLADKDKHIVKLETELRTKKAKSEPEDTDDAVTWLVAHSDDLKLVSKEYKEELEFYKSHKIPVTAEIRERALASAKARKGVRPSAEADRQTETVTPGAGEMRKTTRTGEVPAEIKALYPNMTPEQYAKHKAELDQGKKS